MLELAAASETVPGRREIELGDPALASISLKAIQVARRGSFRHGPTTANAIYAVIKGDGACTVDERGFVWTRGDVIAVPTGCTMVCRTTEDSYLLKVADEPLFRDLGWLRPIPAVR